MEEKQKRIEFLEKKVQTKDEAGGSATGYLTPTEAFSVVTAPVLELDTAVI